MSESEPLDEGGEPEPTGPRPEADQPRQSEQDALGEHEAARERALRENIPGRQGDEPSEKTADRLEETKLKPIGDAPKEKPPEKPFFGRGQKGRSRRKKKKPEAK
ncbi:MAG: hypothetical protein HYS86_04065 [Candidatus Chisholmbacteria bacterium]|nr:hypothetical protein [Candidatus Chisholmbacteria bacterium]